jgi:cytochrome c-type biogenesis protein CcmH/NrfG
MARPPRHSEPKAAPARPRPGWQGWTYHLRERRWRIIGIAVVVALTLAARLPHLGADAPTDVSWSQDLLTDPPQYTAYARNAVSLGEWNPLDDEKLVFFRKNITGVFAYVVFTIFGPGISSADLTAVLFNLVAVGFLAWGVGRAFGFLGGVAAAWFLAVNYLLVSYSRQPFLEVAANACLAAAFWAIISSSRHWWLTILGGLVAGVGTFFGKVTALHAAPIFLIGAALVGWSDTGADGGRGRRRWARPAGYAGGMALVALIWYLFVYRLASEEVLAYLREQSRTLYGAPVGFSSLPAFIRAWFSFGVDTGVLTWAPVMGIVGLAGMCVMLLHYGRIGARRPFLVRVPPAAWLLIGWFFSGYLAFAPFNYRPVRYQIVMLLPLAAAAGWLVQYWATASRHPVRDRETGPLWWTAPVLFVIIATGLEHFLFARLLSPSVRSVTTASYSMAIFVAAIAAIVWIAWHGRQTQRTPAGSGVKPKTIVEVAIAVVLLGSLAEQGRHFVAWWAHPQTTLSSANRDLAAILGPGAVVTGELAPALTQRRDSPRSLNRFFALKEKASFFADRPITHVVAEDKADAAFFKAYPRIAEAAERVTTYTIRNLRIAVLRVAQTGGNAQAATYQLSFLERLRGELGRRPLDSLLAGLTQRIADSADHFSGWFFAADLYHRANRVDEAIYAYERALAFYPDDFVLLGQIGEVYWQRYSTVGGPADKQKAVESWSRALDLLPGNRYLTERLALAR